MKTPRLPTDDKHTRSAPATGAARSAPHVALIGAGPGAADLITMRGLRLLQQAQCILHDALVSTELLAMASPDALLIPVGKRCGKQSTAQHFINKQLVDAARKYQRVVRLKGGDPMMFGRADEEMRALRAAGIEFEVVPGITTALAAASELQASLTLRGVSRSVALMTPAVGHGETPHDMTDNIPGADTLAVYMGLQQAAVWASDLIKAGRSVDMPVIVAESVSLPNQRMTPMTLAGLSQMDAQTHSAPTGPCLILIGEAMRDAAQRNDGLTDDNGLNPLTTQGLNSEQFRVVS